MNPSRARSEILPLPEEYRSISTIKHLLATRDYQEVINFSFVEQSWEADFCNNLTPIKISNPIASQMSMMRSSLIGGLIANLKQNINHKLERIRIYEVGRCFHKNRPSGISSSDSEPFFQPLMVGGLCYGSAFDEQWGAPARLVDFYDVKADIEALSAPTSFHFQEASHPALHPGKSAAIFNHTTLIGYLGELHPKWQQKYDLPQPVILFELALEGLVKILLPRYKEISKFPPVVRDLAIIVDRAITNQKLVDGLTANCSGLVTEIRLFDVYQGEGVAVDKKSLAFRIVMQDTQRTLTDEVVEAERQKIIQYLESNFGAKLRI